MKTRFYVRHIKTLYAIGLSGVLLALIWHYHLPLMGALKALRDPQAVCEYLRGFGLLGPLVLSLLLLAQVFLAMIPGHALVMASGYIYGAPLTIAVVATSTIAGSQLAFILARKYGRPLIHRLAPPAAIDRWDSIAGDRGGLFYFFTFVMPIFPADMMCYVAGLGKVPPKDFFAANVAGRLLAATAITLIGAFGLQPPLWFWLLFAGCMAALALAWCIYNKTFRRLPSQSEFAYACGLALMKTYVALFALKHRVKGLENLPPGPKILAANHPNISDAFQLPLLLKDRLTVVAQASQFRAILLGWILTHSGAIPVHNGRGREAFELSCQALREGKTVLIFPEGTVNPEGRQMKARSGTVRMALATGVPIVPIGIYVPARDTIDLRYTTHGVGHLGRWQFRGTFSVQIGRPWCPAKGLSAKGNRPTVHALTRRLMDRIYTLVRSAAIMEPAPEPFAIQVPQR